MTQEKFIQDLRHELSGLPGDDIEEIVADYCSYFDEARAAGRDIEDVVAAHGDPRRLAQELRAEMDLRQWEEHHTPQNFWKAVIALGGVAAVDLVVLLPSLLMLGLTALILFFVLSLLGIIGIGTLLDVISDSHDPAQGSATYLVLRSFGHLATSIGGGFLLVFALRKGLVQLTRHMRCRYLLLRTRFPGMGQSNSD
ncbi:DUF1700 domain-containing protein [Roseibium alexandrii]|uniref:Putative membrane protein n=1 Tax=Roseibium alexandrii TaxID=388408 RepID=A0A0M6ZXY5_9HYPH|nr:DUF1700 domain-containing protein [Roseibium alexandrii]CTQ67056.1 putative membrane protein [Roseibium alexandrii]